MTLSSINLQKGRGGGGGGVILAWCRNIGYKMCDKE